MKFVKFEVHTIETPYDQEKEKCVEELVLQGQTYINIRRIKNFKVFWYKGVTKFIFLNNDWDEDKYHRLHHIPADKDQFKEAFGLDWDEL